MKERFSITPQTTVEEIVKAQLEAFGKGTVGGIFQAVAASADGKPMLVTIITSVEPYAGQSLLPGHGGMTMQ